VPKFISCVLLADRHHGLPEGLRGLLATAFRSVVMVADEDRPSPQPRHRPEPFQRMTPIKPTLTARSLALALIAAACATTTLAQQAPSPAGGVAVVSEPGKAAAVRTVEVSAKVVGIDKATRTLTLKGAKGEVFDLVASDEVRNFDQIKVGDTVVARFGQALTLELKKTQVAAGGPVVSEGVAAAKPGERPAVVGARQVTVIADVIAVDPKASTITLKGPRGNVVTLDVRNPEQFKVVKKGDQIEATYTEALALSVEPAPKPAAK
jgi:hypothetical protein